MMKTKRIEIANDFSPFPAGRYEKDGPFTGEGFRRKFLVPALNSCDKVEIIFDGTVGYGSSFLEESFGGLVREENFSEEALVNKLILISSRKTIPYEVLNYIKKAQHEKSKS